MTKAEYLSIGRMMGLSVAETLGNKMGLIYDMFEIYKTQNGFNVKEEV